MRLLSDFRGTDDAKSVHLEHPPICLHADPLMWHFTGYDMTVRHMPLLPGAAFMGHVDVPRMHQAGCGAQFFGLVSLPHVHRDCFGTVMRQINELERLCRYGPNCMTLAVSHDDVVTANKRGRIAALLGLEGAHPIRGRPELLDRLHRRRVRYLGLVHFSANETGYPAFGLGRRDLRGLNAFGYGIIRKCEELGIIVDLAHLNRRGFMDACRIAEKPLIVSHAGVYDAHRSWRNIDNEQLRAVADTGGVIGIIFADYYLGGRTIGHLVRHIEHAVDIAGEDAVALGSDYDGMIRPVRGLEDISNLPHLTDVLLARGWPLRRIGKLLNGNVMRLLKDVPYKNVS